MNWIKRMFCKCSILKAENTLWQEINASLGRENERLTNHCPPDIGNTEGSAFEIGNNIYRLRDNAMTLVPDGVYTHEGKYAVIDNEVLIYFK